MSVQQSVRGIPVTHEALVFHQFTIPGLGEIGLALPTTS